MKKIGLCVLLLTCCIFSNAQQFPSSELIYLTSQWKGERFEDGRPKISDDLIARARKIGIEEAWQVLYNEGYKNQFEGNWKMVHDNVPVVGSVTPVAPVTVNVVAKAPEIANVLATLFATPVPPPTGLRIPVEPMLETLT